MTNRSKNLLICATLFSFPRGAEGGVPPVGKTQAHNPTAKPEVGRDLLGKGDLGPAAGVVPMRGFGRLSAVALLGFCCAGWVTAAGFCGCDPQVPSPSKLGRRNEV